MQLALEKPEGLQELELSLEASFTSKSLGPSIFDRCHQRKLIFLKALQALKCKLPCCKKAFETCSHLKDLTHSMTAPNMLQRCSKHSANML